jgi:hypothetical protein
MTVVQVQPAFWGTQLPQGLLALAVLRVSVGIGLSTGLRCGSLIATA